MHDLPLLLPPELDDEPELDELDDELELDEDELLEPVLVLVIIPDEVEVEPPLVEVLPPDVLLEPLVVEVTTMLPPLLDPPKKPPKKPPKPPPLEPPMITAGLPPPAAMTGPWGCSGSGARGTGTIAYSSSCCLGTTRRTRFT